MKLHRRARSCPNSRLLFCQRIEERGWSLKAAAEAAGFSERTGRKWLARYRAEGEEGLLDRPSAPATVANRTPEERIEAKLDRLLEERGIDPDEISRQVNQAL